MPLDSSGFTPRSMDEIRAALSDDLRARFGQDLLTDSPDSVIGQLLAIFASRLSEVEELGAALFDAFSPDAAEGVALDNLSGIVGVSRRPSTPARGEVTLSGVAGTTIPAGKILRDQAGVTFVTLAAATLDGGGEANVAVEAEVAGAVRVPSGTLDQIVTPVSGWAGVTNTLDLVDGVDVESDAALRLRRERSLAIVGSGTDGAIAARLREIATVEAAVVVSNRSDDVDADGRPPHSFEAVIWPNAGVDEDAVTATVWLNAPAGIEFAGDELFEVVDEFGFAHDVRWSYAVAVEVWIAVDVEVNDLFPDDGEDQVAEAILAVGAGVTIEAAAASTQAAALRRIVGDGLSVGDALRILKIGAALDTVPGVIAAAIRVGLADPPLSGADIVISPTQIIDLDSSRVVVNLI